MQNPAQKYIWEEYPLEEYKKEFSADEKDLEKPSPIFNEWQKKEGEWYEKNKDRETNWLKNVDKKLWTYEVLFQYYTYQHYRLVTDLGIYNDQVVGVLKQQATKYTKGVKENFIPGKTDETDPDAVKWEKAVSELEHKYWQLKERFRKKWGHRLAVILQTKPAKKREAVHNYIDENTVWGDFKSASGIPSSFLLDKATVLENSSSLGSGAFSKVYKISLYNTTYALKVLLIEEKLKNFENQIVLFNNEVKALHELSNPNIIKLYHYCSDTSNSEVPFLAIVMEFCENNSLQDLLCNPNITITYSRKVKIMNQIISGMTYLHSLKPSPIFHLDLKPSNILFGRKYDVKIADFGLSVVANQHLVGGTPYFMPPEALTTPPSSPSYANDVYAFALIMGLLWSKTSTLRFPTFTTLSPISLDEFKKMIQSESFRPDFTSHSQTPIPPLLLKKIEIWWQHDPKLRPTFEHIGNEDIPKLLEDEYIADAELKKPETKGVLTEMSLPNWCDCMAKTFDDETQNFRNEGVTSFLAIQFGINSKTASSKQMVSVEHTKMFQEWFADVKNGDVVGLISDITNEEWFWGNCSDRMMTDDDILKAFRDVENEEGKYIICWRNGKFVSYVVEEKVEMSENKKVKKNFQVAQKPLPNVRTIKNLQSFMQAEKGKSKKERTYKKPLISTIRPIRSISRQKTTDVSTYVRMNFII